MKLRQKYWIAIISTCSVLSSGALYATSFDEEEETIIEEEVISTTSHPPKEIRQHNLSTRSTPQQGIHPLKDITRRPAESLGVGSQHVR